MAVAVPFGFKVSTGIGACVSGYGAPFIASDNGGSIACAVAGFVAGQMSSVIWLGVSGNMVWVGLVTCSEIHPEPKAFEFVISLSLPWFVGSVFSVGWLRSESLTEGGVGVTLALMVVMGF